MSTKFSCTALIGLIVGAVVALPIYAQLQDNIRTAPNLYFLTIGTCFVGWGLGAMLHAGAKLLHRRCIARGIRR